MKIKEIIGSTYFRIFFSITLIVILIKQQDFTKVLENFQDFNYFALIGAFILLMLGTLLSAYRWQAILKTSNKDLSVGYLYSLYIKGYFYNNFLPTQLGGDVYKSVALGSKIKDQSLSLFSVFMDRFSGLLVLLAVAMFGVANLLGLEYLMGAIVLAIIGLFLYFPVLNILAKKIKFFKKFRDASLLLVKDKKQGVKIILLSLGIQLLSYSQTYVLFLGLGINLSFEAVFGYLPIISFGILLPTFNGIGSQEFLYKELFKFANIEISKSVTVSLMMHIIRFMMSLLGGLLILFGVGNSKDDVKNFGKKKEE